MTGMMISQWRRMPAQLKKLGHPVHAARVAAYIALPAADRKHQLHLCTNPNLKRCNHGRG